MLDPTRSERKRFALSTISLIHSKSLPCTLAERPLSYCYRAATCHTPLSLTMILDDISQSLRDLLTLNVRRLHGRRAATALLGLSLLLSMLMIFFQAELLPPDALEYLDIMPTIHAKDILARQFAAMDLKKRTVYQSLEWESSYDEEKEDYKSCTLNQPKDRMKHGCSVDTDSKIAYCQIKHLLIDLNKITGSAIGGEPLKDTMGRDEDMEFPTYLPGAFTTPTSVRFSPSSMKRDYWYYLLDVFTALDINRKKARKCGDMLSGVSLLITRYEYVDMYHSLKDWWNAFMVLPEAQKVERVIFLDAHAEGHLDSVWKDLFGKEVMHVNQFKNDLTCLETAIFVPPGYSSVLWHLGREYKGKRCTAMSNAFVDFVIKQYGVDNIQLQNKSILILDQAPHIIHPRSNLTGDAYDNSFLSEIQAKLLDETDALPVQVVDLHKLSFRAQLKLIRQAHIMIGYHGSQMAHCLFLQKGSTCMEIKENSPDFVDLLKWRPDVSYTKFFAQTPNLLDYEIVPGVKDVIEPGWDREKGAKRYPPSYYTRYQWNSTDQFAGFGTGMMDDRINPVIPWEDNPLVEPWGFTNVKYDIAKEYQECAVNQPKPRPEHGCRVDPNTQIPYCNIKNLRIDVSKIVAPRGGEDLDTVMGRVEDVEFPKYKKGALSTDRKLDIPVDIDKKMFYYLENVTNALSYTPDQVCNKILSTPTLFLTRYDYVNLFHTLTDWWNAFFVLPEGNREVNVIFLDAHANGLWDPVWNQAFGQVSHVMWLPKGGVCFRDAIFVPSGYSSVLSPRDRSFTMSSPCPVMTTAFLNHFVKKYKLGKEEMEQGRVTIIDRVPSVNHPRSNITNEVKLIENLEHVKDRIMQETNATSVEVVRLEQLPFVEQLRTMRKTHVLIGHCGAGLSHLIFLPDGAHVLELQYSSHMSELAKWKPNITRRTVDGIYKKEVPEEVITRSILSAVNYALNNKDTTGGTSSVERGDNEGDKMTTSKKKDSQDEDDTVEEDKGEEGDKSEEARDEDKGDDEQDNGEVENNNGEGEGTDEDEDQNVEEHINEAEDGEDGNGENAEEENEE